MSLIYDHNGARKYLTAAERRAFLMAAAHAPLQVYTLCATLAYTGARISEVLALTSRDFDLEERVVRIKCLKKRRPCIFRSVPLPNSLLRSLDEAHSLQCAERSQTRRLWPWCRTTAWKHVKNIMREAGIDGRHACPKGLRHSFGVLAIQQSVPLNMVRKWLGHSRLSTTAIYADAIGEEEQRIAQRAWRAF